MFAYGAHPQVNVPGLEWPPAQPWELVQRCSDDHMWSLQEHPEVDGLPIPFMSRHVGPVVMMYFVAQDSGSGV